MLADADLERAANGIAWGGMFTSGQVCVSVERAFVEAPVYDEFLAKLTEKVRAVQQGQEDRGFTYDIGAMATGAQRDIVARHVREASAAGARVLTGGKPTGVGTFFEPTVLADVDPTDDLHDRGDLRPHVAGDESGRRGRGHSARQRFGVRPLGDGVEFG